MKQILTLTMATVILVSLFSCTNDSDSTNEDSSTVLTDSSAASNSNTIESEGPAVPFNVFNIYHTVQDYKVWRAAFDADSTGRATNGLSTIAVERAVDKPNDIKIVLQAPDLDKAKAFAADPRLKDVMGKAGVVSKPDMQYWKVVRLSPENKKPGTARLQIVHKVKDYDAWLEGYEAEGAATRAANGMTEFALARSIDDPNLVHIAFTVSDMNKVKERLADPALKKIMMDAGVVGEPSIIFYNDVTNQ